MLEVIVGLSTVADLALRILGIGAVVAVAAAIHPDPTARRSSGTTQSHRF